MNEFFLGAVTLEFIVIALYFFRFWRQTRDVLFALFALSFLVLGLSQAAFAAVADPTEGRPIFYLPRLLAYLLIIAGIVTKNARPKT